MGAHVVARRRNVEDIQRIGDMLKIKTAPRFIAGVIRATGNKMLLPKDVRNIKSAQRLKKLDGKNSTEALLDFLGRDDQWKFEYKCDEKGNLARLFFVHDSARELVVRYHYVVLME